MQEERSSTGSTDSATNEAARHLVSLITNQDQVTKTWVQFLITVEAGLVVAFAFLMKSEGNGPFPDWFIQTGSSLIPAAGILFAIVLTLIIIRERQWQSWYVQRFTSLPNLSLSEIFPVEGQLVRAQPIGYISWVIIIVAALCAAGWLWIWYRL